MDIEYARQATRAWRKTHQHPCLTCGKPCDARATRCHHCARVERWRPVKKPPRFCLCCGKPISINATRCPGCERRHQWKEGNHPPESRAKGKQHGRWKGGRFSDGQGYIRVYCPNHPRCPKTGNHVGEHILMWEQANNKPLPKGWVIHHLNGIKDDNRPINLVAMPNMKHFNLLDAKAKRIQELEALLEKQHQLL